MPISSLCALHSFYKFLWTHWLVIKELFWPQFLWTSLLFPSDSPGHPHYSIPWLGKSCSEFFTDLLIQWHWHCWFLTEYLFHSWGYWRDVHLSFFLVWLYKHKLGMDCPYQCISKQSQINLYLEHLFKEYTCQFVSFIWNILNYINFTFHITTTLVI